jgi:transposase, IS30 family
MDYQKHIIIAPERKRGQHLQSEERGAIQYLKRLGHSNRAIARELRCSPTTVGNELMRGTPTRKGKRGRAPGYSAKLGEAIYKTNRERCRKPHKLGACPAFLAWIVKQFREQHWSIDASVGYARLHGLFGENEMVCTSTLYNELWADNLPLRLTEMPEVLKRKRRKSTVRERKRSFGTSIDQRPEIAAKREEEGHWEGDTMVGLRTGKEAVILTLLEKKTNTYLAIRIPEKTSKAVMAAMAGLRQEYGDRFAEVFKTITVDNGSEFADFSEIEEWGTKVYFAHPYTSWERPQNERNNGLFRRYVPKGTSMEKYSADYILDSADELNGRPRRKLAYRTPEELFEAFLDKVYAA